MPGKVTKLRSYGSGVGISSGPITGFEATTNGAIGVCLEYMPPVRASEFSLSLINIASRDRPGFASLSLGRPASKSHFNTKNHMEPKPVVPPALAQKCTLTPARAASTPRRQVSLGDQ
jgi:hypothetical protein